jgi:hypothetical protein
VSASRVGLLVYRYTHLSFRADPYNEFFQLFLEKEKIYNAISAVFQGRMSKTTHAAMCNGELSLVIMRWGHLQPVSLANWIYPHVCKNWDDVVNWSKEHSMPHLKDPGWLNHPHLDKPPVNVNEA